MQISSIANAEIPELMERVGAVSPRQACSLLGVGTTRLYELIRAGEIESYRDGSSRRVTLRSIVARRDRLLLQSPVDHRATGPPGR